MITFSVYRNFLKELSSHGINSIRVDQIKGGGNYENTLILKHDVESLPHLALKMAQIEAEFGYLATYYIQGDLLLCSDVAKIVRDICNLGHEVAYHYDVLDAADGNFIDATNAFDRYKSLIELQTGVCLKTVCPHGNPIKKRSGWLSNKDFFRNPHIRAKYRDIIDIVVDFPRVLPKGVYVSDAGFSLRVINNISQNDSSNESASADGASIYWTDLPNIIKTSQGLILSTHPHRYRDSEISIFFLLSRAKLLKLCYRLIKRVPIFEILIGKFYSITRYF